MDDPPIFRELAGGPIESVGSTYHPAGVTQPAVPTGPGAPRSHAPRAAQCRLPVRAPGMSLLAEFARDVLADHCLDGDHCTCGLPAVECTVIQREYQYDLIAGDPPADW